MLEGEGADAGVEYFPVSAASGQGIDALVDAVLARLPVGPPYFPEGMVTDVPEAFWVAELVREQLLAHVREELPHSIACRVTEWEWPRVRIEIIVERESQKGMVIGKGGAMLKDVGTAVRAQLPPGAFVELRVRVEKHWQQRPDMIERLGLLSLSPGPTSRPGRRRRVGRWPGGRRRPRRGRWCVAWGAARQERRGGSWRWRDASRARPPPRCRWTTG